MFILPPEKISSCAVCLLSLSGVVRHVHSTTCKRVFIFYNLINKSFDTLQVIVFMNISLEAKTMVKTSGETE